jgi:hypothetical protein
MMFDRRRVPRQAVGLEGSVHVPLRAPLAALITNISPNGAMVEVDRWEFVPAQFKLMLGDFETLCFVRHRDKKLIGVEFETTYDMAHDMMPLFAAETWSVQGANLHHGL